MKAMKQNTQRGSAIFFILIGVVLFAALSFAVGNMLRGGGADMVSDDKARILADEMIDYARQVKQAVQHIRISNGCSDTEISFLNSAVSGYARVPESRDECQVFNSSGGGINYSYIPAQARDSADSSKSNFGETAFTGLVYVIGVGQDCANASCNELLLMASYINQKVCAKINKALGLGVDMTDESITGVEPNTADFFKKVGKRTVLIFLIGWLL